MATLLPSVSFKTAAELVNLDMGFHPENLGAGLLARPSTVGEISQLLTHCNSAGISVVAQGGRTGLAGAAVTHHEQLIIDVSELNDIIDIDAQSGVAHVQSGVTLQALEDEAKKIGLSCGIDLAARGSATIGGLVSTNAGGIEAFRHGMMRHRILGVEAVLADGQVFSDLKRVVKANEGYDLKQLFIGAEGTLGIVTSVVLSLVPLIEQSTTTLVSCPCASHAVQVFRQLHNDLSVNLLAAEIMWPLYARTVADYCGLSSTLDFEESTDVVYVILDFAGESDSQIDQVESALSVLIEQEIIGNAIVASSEQQARNIWKIREESFVIDNRMPDGLWYDISVPLDQLSVYTENIFNRIAEIDSDLNLFLMGHLGDGNLHATVSKGQPIGDLKQAVDAAVYDTLSSLGGSFSAEHGIGIEKRHVLKASVPSTNLSLMKSIKALLDPNNIMNPGKVL